MEAIKVEKTIKLNKFEIVKYQLMHHCFISNIRINETELNCLALLGELGSIRLTEFGKKASEKGFLGNPMAANNCLSKLEKSNLFIKKGAGKKIIFLNPELNIKSEGNIILEFKLFKFETNKSAGNLQNNRKETELA